MNNKLELWLKSVHRNKHWWIYKGRWMDGDGPCVRDRGPASQDEIAKYEELSLDNKVSKKHN